jgi:hypothetical protein
MMYHCKHALIVYVPAYSLLHGCVAANTARMRQCHVSRLLHMKHDVTSKGTPKWSLGKRGVQKRNKKLVKKNNLSTLVFTRTPRAKIAVDKPGCYSGYILIAV